MMIREVNATAPQSRYDTYELLSGLKVSELDVLRKLAPEVSKRFEEEKQGLSSETGKIVDSVREIARDYALLFFHEEFFRSMRNTKAEMDHILLEERKRLKGDESALAEIAKDHEENDRELERLRNDYMEKRNRLSIRHIGEEPETVQEKFAEQAADIVASKTRGLSAWARKAVYMCVLSTLNGSIRHWYSDANALIDSAMLAILESETDDLARFELASGFPVAKEDEKSIPPMVLAWPGIRAE